jgi:hypothetical protein
MRASTALVTLAAITASSGCVDPHNSSPGNNRFSTAPTPVSPAPTRHGVLVISSFVVTFNGQYLMADWTLTETSGESAVSVVSLTFEESDGLSDHLDDWCWGDAPIRIGPLGSVNPKTPGLGLGDYCQPRIVTKAPGDFAALIVVYRQNDGTQETVRATVTVRR